MRMKTKELVTAGLFAALLALFSQAAIPTPFGMSLTLQTFAVAFGGFLLKARLSVVSVSQCCAEKMSDDFSAFLQRKGADYGKRYSDEITDKGNAECVTIQCIPQSGPFQAKADNGQRQIIVRKIDDDTDGRNGGYDF